MIPTILFKREGGVFGGGRILADVNDLIGSFNHAILEIKNLNHSKNPEFYRGVLYGMESFRDDLEDSSQRAQEKMK